MPRTRQIESRTALSLVTEEVDRLTVDIELLRQRCEQALQASSGFSPFLFASQSGSSDSQQQQQQQPPQPTLQKSPAADFDRGAQKRRQAPAQTRNGGAGRSVELPDAFVSGVGLAFSANAAAAAAAAAPGLSSSAILTAVQQRDRGGDSNRHGRSRNQDLQQQQPLHRSAFSTSSDAATADNQTDLTSCCPPISQSQMIGSSAANQLGALAGPQSDSRRMTQQQRRYSTVKLSANQSRPEETVPEKFLYCDPAAGPNQPAQFLQRLSELSALQAETVRHEKMKASKRKFRC